MIISQAKQAILGGEPRVAVEVIFAIAEAIRGLREVPNGELYVHVCGKLDLGQYEAIIRTLKGAGLIEEKANMLRWIGPQLAA